jgi:hypothetical protein
MYDDEDEDYLDEENVELDEIDARRELNDSKISTRVTKGIKNKVGTAVKATAKKAAKAAWNGLKVALKKLLMLVVSHPVVFLVILGIIVLAIIVFVIMEQLSSSATSNVDSYISSITDSMDEAAKEAYNKNSSLLLLKVSDINDMYDAYMKSDTVGNDLKTIMQTVFGTNSVEGSAVYSNKKEFTPKDVLNTAKNLTKKFADEKYVYGDPTYVPAAINGNTGGVEVDGEGNRLKSVDKCISSSGFVSWILNELGLKDQPQTGLKIGAENNTNGRGLEWYCESNKFQRITDVNALEPGDIVLLKDRKTNVVTHTYIFDSWKNKGEQECKAYDCGSKEWIQSGSQPITRKIASEGKVFSCAYRPSSTPYVEE